MKNVSEMCADLPPTSDFKGKKELMGIKLRVEREQRHQTRVCMEIIKLHPAV